jgi:hypothetical protein
MELMQKDTKPATTVQEFVQRLVEKVRPFIDDLRDSIASHAAPNERARHVGKFNTKPRWDFEGIDDLVALLRHEYPFEDFEYFQNRLLLDYAFLVEEARSEVEARYCQEYLVGYRPLIKFCDDVLASDPKLNGRLAARIEYLNAVRALEEKQAQSIVEEGSK